jgi:hypothetical protein
MILKQFKRLGVTLNKHPYIMKVTPQSVKRELKRTIFLKVFWALCEGQASSLKIA